MSVDFAVKSFKVESAFRNHEHVSVFVLFNLLVDGLSLHLLFLLFVDLSCWLCLLTDSEQLLFRVVLLVSTLKTGSSVEFRSNHPI